MTDSPRSIVCGIDDQGFSDEAVVAAYARARERDLRVHLVHASGLGGLIDRLTGEDLDRARAQTVERLEGRLAEAGIEAPEVDARLELVDGPPARVLVETATREDADAIALGRHHGLAAVGDTVRAVLAHAPCPVLVQPASRPGARPIRRILAAVDLSPESAHVLTAARDEARAAGAGGDAVSVAVLHCFVRPDLGYVFGYSVPLPSGIVEKARDTAHQAFFEEVRAFDWQGLQPTLDFVEAEPATEILARQEDADLVVVGSHGRTGLSLSVLGAVAGRVLHACEAPVLAVRAPDRSWAL